MIAEKIGIEKSHLLVNENEKLRDLIIGMYPELSAMSFQIAINNELKEEIDHNDNNLSIAILPPFAGG